MTEPRVEYRLIWDEEEGDTWRPREVIGTYLGMSGQATRLRKLSQDSDGHIRNVHFQYRTISAWKSVDPWHEGQERSAPQQVETTGPVDYITASHDDRTARTKREPDGA